MTASSLLRDAYAMLLPAWGDIPGDGEARAFYGSGGIAGLLGCTRAEYVARRMSAERAAAETPEAFRAFAAAARDGAGVPVLVAIDYEIGGVHRLHRLAPQLSHPREALSMSDAEIESFGRAAARAARDLGINLFLAPVLDLLTGENTWLRNRTLETSPDTAGRIISAYIRGVQAEGVIATAKHFPGFPEMRADAFDDAEVRVELTADQLVPGHAPFRQAIAEGVKAVMTGPVPVAAWDPVEPASTSAIVVGRLRNAFGFRGLIISDDLDLPGTLRGRSMVDTAIASVRAGVQLLLLAAGPQVESVAMAIAGAAEADETIAAQVKEAAAKVRSIAHAAA